MSAASPVRDEPPARLAAGVVLLPGLDEGARERLVELPTGGMARVGADMGRLLDELAGDDANATAEGLAARLGAPWTPRIVRGALRRLAEMGITARGGAVAAAPRRASRGRRLEYRPPLSLQLTLLRPERILPAGSPVLRALTGPVAAAVALAALLAGLPALVSAFAAAGPLHRPAALGTYVLALAGVLVTVSIHELAHGATLAAHGGRPRRMGVMIFYLLPAFFCDVSDAWRLAPQARVRVALAGITVQGALGGLAAIAAIPASGDLEQGLAFYAVLAYAYGAVNLVPLIKLDGYVALAGGLDIPHLRRKAMDDFQDALARAALGARRTPRRLRHGWTTWFGAACTLAPGVVLASAVGTLAPSLLPIGTPGAIVALVLAALLAWLLVHAVMRWLVRAVRLGASPVRMGAVVGATVVVVALALATVQVPRTLHGGFATVDGRPALVLGLGAAAADDLRPGTTVDIARNGLVPGETVARATVTGRPRVCHAPLGAIVPVRDTSHTLTALCLPVETASRATPDGGRVAARLDSVPAGQRLAEVFILPALQTLGIAGR